MIKKDKESDKITTTPGRVKQICQNFLVHSDSGLAHRLQEEEYAMHYDRNRTHRHESRLGVKAARDVEEEEKQTFVAKQFDFYQQKQQIEENDIALARKLQDDLNIQSNSIDKSTYSTHHHHHHSSNEQNYYKDINQSSMNVDTSNDEQLARILQEEEELLSTHHSHIPSTLV